MEFKDYYKTLGVERSASQDDIRHAYRKLARKYHPDVSKEADAEERMRDVNEANDVLRDEEKRAQYNAMLDQIASRGHHSNEGFQAPPNWDEGFEFYRSSDGHHSVDNEEFSEFFSSLFGQAQQRKRSQQNQQSQQGQYNQRVRGEDQHAAIEISVEESFNGAEKEITLRALKHDAQGQLAFENRTLHVKIPAGVQAGQYIRLSAQGLPGYGGEAAGDLYLEVRIAPHSRYRIEGNDLYMGLPVSPTEAALGAKIEVPIPSGKNVAVSVPPNSRAGMKLRLRDYGLKGKEQGHLYLVLEVVLPPAHSEAAKQAYQHLAEAAPFDPRPEWKGHAS